MGFFNRIFGGKASGSTDGDPDGMHVYVKCDRCGEKIHIRVNKRTDITPEYPEGSDRSVPTLHKEILGSGCQNLMFIHLNLDSSYGIVEARAAEFFIGGV